MYDSQREKDFDEAVDRIPCGTYYSYTETTTGGEKYITLFGNGYTGDTITIKEKRNDSNNM